MLEKINSVLCGLVLPISIFFVGVFFLFRLRFFYILHPIASSKRIVGAGGGFRPLCVALAGTLGVGNIVGVSSAIIMGGAGSVFWMILSALVAMSVKYAESYLAIKHRRGCVDNYYGGAPYYISDACSKSGKKRALGGIFATLCTLNSLSTGNLVQINSISEIFRGNALLFGVLFTLGVVLVVSGGEKRIQSASSVLIPILTLCYVIISFYIIFGNLDRACVAVSTVFAEAFSLKSIGSGVFGFTMARAIRFGLSRGLLSNEAGCGTSTVAHASSSSDAPSQGCLGVVEVFWDTVILCSLTALVILISDVKSSSPLELAICSYERYTGLFGRGFIATSLVLFALATVCCQYYYGTKSIGFLSSSRALKLLYSVIFFSVCIASSIISSEVMWQISDFIIASLALYNLVFLLILSKEVSPP